MKLATSGQRQCRGPPRIGMVGGGLGVGEIVIALVAYFLGFDPAVVMNVAEQVGTQSETREAPKGAPRTRWAVCCQDPRQHRGRLGQDLQQSKSEYRAPTLVLYDGQVRSTCGLGQSAMGPFYCPEDEKLYIDLAFLRDLQTRFRAPGDFAQAYVIAHEVGHHVQKLTGAFQQVEAARGARLPGRIEPDFRAHGAAADCYAGVWGHHAGTMNQLDSGDIAEALNAATAIGDDRLQKQTQGRVVPETFTHGSSEQRVRWFKRGMDSGQPKDCDTLSTGSP